MKKEDFDQVYKILDESFPEEEKRNYEEQFSLLNDKRCKIFVERDKNGKIIVFFSVWVFDNFCFGEHLATDKNYRNLGLGKKLLESCLKYFDKPFILEVEPPRDEMSIRRINFYKRLGFYLNNFEYKQPALQKHTHPCDLYVMSYPSLLSKSEFLYFRNEIFKNIYKVLPSSVGLKD